MQLARGPRPGHSLGKAAETAFASCIQVAKIVFGMFEFQCLVARLGQFCNLPVNDIMLCKACAISLTDSQKRVEYRNDQRFYYSDWPPASLARPLCQSV